MAIIKCEVIIKADPEKVWDYLTTYENYCKWMEGLRDITVVDKASKAGVGTRCRETWRLGIASRTYDVEVVEYVPFVTHVARAGNDWQGVWKLLSIPSGTRLEWLLTYRPPLGPVGWIIDHLWLSRRLSQAMERSLELLRSQIEMPTST